MRALLAEMGYTHIDQIIGDSDLLEKRDVVQHWKARGLDFSKMFYKPDAPHEAVHWTERQKHPIDDVLDRKLIELAKPALEAKQPVKIEVDIRNVDRSTGAMLSGEVAKRFKHKGLREDTIQVKLTGTAGQSFGAFLARGVSFELVGAGNDYVGKGLSGGRIVIRPPEEARIVAADSIIVGNTVLYGATEGEAYFAGVAGERFAVRNSGVAAVVEGVGDHVVVVGGGDTASDCVGTAFRQGAVRVTQLDIRPQPPEKEDKLAVWPYWATKMRTSSSQAEGAEREFQVATLEFIGEDGQLTGVKCCEVDEKRKPIAGTEFVIRADLAFIAIGFAGPAMVGVAKELEGEMKIVTDSRRSRNVEANDRDYRTSVDRLYAAGDVRRGQSLVVWAIREGRQAARSIDEALMGASVLPR